MPQTRLPPARPKIGIIADDLTGAAELAGVAWRFGFTAELHTGLNRVPHSEVLAIDTDSRHCTEAEATRRVTAATRCLELLGVEWIYKKVDSVLRGCVLPEIQAILRVLRLKRALLVPANPSRGRIIQHGIYLIDGTPVDQTDFRNDPQHPRNSSLVLEILGDKGSAIVSICRPDEPLPALGVVIGEAAAPADLQVWAGRLEATILPAGAAEFFAAILESGKGAAHFPARPISLRSVDGPALFVCGSKSASTQGFLDDCRRRGCPVVRMPEAFFQKSGFRATLMRQWAREVTTAFERCPRVVVAIDQPAREGSAEIFGEILVTVVKLVLSQVPVKQINVEGGATASLLMRVMGWSCLSLMQEVSPGVVMLRVGSSIPIAITIKPGSYEWPLLMRGD
jgi:D-threonate/D-erythronate kinase